MFYLFFGRFLFFFLGFSFSEGWGLDVKKNERMINWGITSTPTLPLLLLLLPPPPFEAAPFEVLFSLLFFFVLLEFGLGFGLGFGLCFEDDFEMIFFSAWEMQWATCFSRFSQVMKPKEVEQMGQV